MEAAKVGECIEPRIFSTKKTNLVNVEFNDGSAVEYYSFHSHPHEQVSNVTKGEIYLFVDDNEKKHLKAAVILPFLQMCQTQFKA